MNLYSDSTSQREANAAGKYSEALNKGPTHAMPASYSSETRGLKSGYSQVWWLTPVIPATQKVEAGRLQI
jgi:hypothetical protein